MLRENLDLGRPDHVQLIFNRRVSRRTRTRYRTRVITDGVIPSLHVDYKKSRIKQYYKEGRALRTETAINDTYDFGVGRRLKNLDDLKQSGFAANRVPELGRAPRRAPRHPGALEGRIDLPDLCLDEIVQFPGDDLQDVDAHPGHRLLCTHHGRTAGDEKCGDDYDHEPTTWRFIALSWLMAETHTSANT